MVGPMLITGWRQPNPSNGSEFLDSPLAEKDSHKRRRSYILAGMSKKILRTVVPEVPRAIFEEFLDELVKTDTPKAVIERLREALLSGEGYSETTIRAAIGPDDRAP